jgi:hypothetical protein
MDSINRIPLVWDTEDDKNLLGSLFPQGLKSSGFSSGNKFPQFPINNDFTTLSPKDIGNKYYGNNQVYEQGGIKVYADDDIPIKGGTLEEVKVYDNDFYKDFKDFSFTLFVTKNGARLLSQFKECVVSSNEIALFLEIDDVNNFTGSVMEAKVGSNVDRSKLPIAEMLIFMRSKKVNLEDKDIIELINGAFQSRNSLLNWIGSVAIKVATGITSFVFKGVNLLNQAFIDLFDALLIAENHWNTEAKEYSPFFVPDKVLELLKTNDNDSKITEAILLPITLQIVGIEKGISSSMALLKPILPDKIYNNLNHNLSLKFQEIDSFLEHIKGAHFLELIKTAAEVANAHLCGFINGIVDFFKGIFEIIGIVLNIVQAQVDFIREPFYYGSLLAEIFENIIGVIVAFDMKQFIIKAFLLPLELLSKTINFVKNINIDLTAIKINLSKVGYIAGYMLGLVAAIIVDAFLTGGVKAVEDIIKALQTFLTKPGTVLKDLIQTVGSKSKAAIDAVIDFIATMANKLKNGAIKLFEDFKQFVDDVFKWLEELFGASKTLDDYIKLSVELVEATKNKTLFQKSNKLDELYEAAKVANKELKTTTNNFAIETKGEAGFRDGLKSKERAIEKIESDYAGDASRLVDIAGSKVVYETVDELYFALNKFNKKYKILKIKDRIQKPLVSGYRDILINVEMKNRHIVEFRLHLKEMDIATETGHKFYQQRRTLEAISTKRELTIEEQITIKKLKAQEKTLYDKAWEKIINK